VDRLFEGLAQQVLAALRVRQVAIHRQNEVIGDQRVGRREEAQRALDDGALVLGQALGVLPQRDVGGHLDFLRHPVVVAGVEVFFPSPFIFERDKLV
jgi:hypothetical protein